MQERWPIEEIAAVAKLRMCHAVPGTGLTPPDWVTRPEGGPPVHILRPAGAGDTSDAPDATLLVLDGRIQLDLKQLDGSEIFASTTGASGHPLDDRTRGRSLIARRAGRWPRATTAERPDLLARNVVGFDVVDGRVGLPTTKVSILKVENLPTHRAVPAGQPQLFIAQEGRLTTLDIHALHRAAITGDVIQWPVPAPPGADVVAPQCWTVKTSQEVPITDTMARVVTLWAVATSRTAAAFETAPIFGPSNAPMLRRSSPLSAVEQTVTSLPAVALSPATRRPAACAPFRPEPSFVFTRQAGPAAGEDIQGATRSARVRIRLGRSRLTSGQDERLGVVLYPPNYFDAAQDFDDDRIRLPNRTGPVSIVDLEDADLGPAGAFITRWGGDPVRKDGSPQRGFLIPPTAFGRR